MKYFGRIIVLLLVLMPSGASAEAPIWKVSKGDFELYIGGTIHILQEQDYPLPVEFERAYDAAEKLIFEVDIAQAASTEFQQRLLEKALYRDGSTLLSHLQPATLRKLQVFLAKRGLPLESMVAFKVGLLVTILTVNELSRHGIQGTGVDQFFNSRALKDQKQTAALETIEQQIDFLTSLGEGKEDELVLQTIDELENLVEEFSTLKSAWRRGDTQTLEDIGLKDFRAFPEAYQAVLVNRNRAWLPEIERMLEDEQIEYVLVGVLHLVGDDSVLAMLVARGYEVERFQDRAHHN
ncbi:MAG: TraB/GumN family protein [Proteobacteria bacterium]|nr:TraB/GumN family protein [Pseudomonadota bacterium]